MIAGGLGGLAGEPQGDVLALGRQFAGKRRHRGRLASLPGRVDEEVLLAIDPLPGVRQPPR
jgi:hypothetical protein